jgi:hypothetical protein
MARRDNRKDSASQNLGLRTDISHSLATLDVSDCSTQATFWQSCILSKQDELEKLGGLPIDAVHNGVLQRYFDSSYRGLSVIYNSALRHQLAPESHQKKHHRRATPEGELDKGGLYDALSKHLNFYPMLSAKEREPTLQGGNPQFERVCEIVGIPCSRASFTYAVRKLRIALLTDHFKCQRYHGAGDIYQHDYDDDDIFTPFEISNSRRSVSHRLTKYSVPAVNPQVPVENYADYLYRSKQARQGRVHWTHLQHPTTELFLAVGQVWHLPGPALSTLCDLQHAQPQIDWIDQTKNSMEVFKWSYMVLPTLYLDHASVENLALYRLWFEWRQDPLKRAKVSPEPPRVHVACVQMKLGILWSPTEANTCLTVESEAYYVGKWTTDHAEHKRGFMSGLLEKLTCACCCRKRHHEDSLGQYHKLAEEEEDDMEAGMSLSNFPALKEQFESIDANSHLTGHKATDPRISRITYEQSFEKVLQTLERQNSPLRLGENYHLVTRIALNRTLEYLDALEIYEAAIDRLSYLLKRRDTESKDDLIQTIEIAKMELNSLQRLIKPFAEFVIPDLMSVASSLQDQYPFVFHYAQDMQNNVRTFLPKCSDLVSKCETLSTTYDRNASDKMNSILNILTFITFVITPFALMTGIYGMNFSVMPELSWPHGYQYFWCIALTLTCLFALILVCLQRN